jgi:polyhydroxyalkanoate synthesis regulator phasin
MAAAMRDVVGAAAGISSFAIESARDLVNYMVRRGQMSQDEATQLLKEVEEAHAKRPQSHLPRLSEKVKAEKDAAKAAEKIRLEKEKAERMAALAAIKPVPKPKEPEKVEKPAEKQAEKPAEKVVAKAAPKPAAKAEPPKASEKPKVAAKPAAKAPAKPAAKAPAKSASKAAPKKK